MNEETVEGEQGARGEPATSESTTSPSVKGEPATPLPVSSRLPGKAASSLPAAHPSVPTGLTLRQRLLLAVVPPIVALVLRTISVTLRFEVVCETGATPATVPATGIYCFWHQCTLPCTYYFRKFHATILVSHSFDGELIARTLAMFGFYTVRGSSSRGGASGLLQLKNMQQLGRPVVFTADGPRGPIYQTKMGPIKLAQMTGTEIGSFYLLPERAWVVKSWDRFLVPKPFSRVAVSWARPVAAPSADAADELLEARRLELNAALERARANAQNYFASGDRKVDW